MPPAGGRPQEARPVARRCPARFARWRGSRPGSRPSGASASPRSVSRAPASPPARSSGGGDTVRLASRPTRGARAGGRGRPARRPTGRPQGPASLPRPAAASSSARRRRSPGPTGASRGGRPPGHGQPTPPWPPGRRPATRPTGAGRPGSGAGREPQNQAAAYRCGNAAPRGKPILQRPSGCGSSRARPARASASSQARQAASRMAASSVDIGYPVPSTRRPSPASSAARWERAQWGPAEAVLQALPDGGDALTRQPPAQLRLRLRGQVARRGRD